MTGTAPGALRDEDAAARRRYQSVLRRIASGCPPALSAEDVASPTCPPALAAVMDDLYADGPERREKLAQLRRGAGVIVYKRRDRALLAVHRSAAGTLAADLFPPRRAR